jgi:HAD superfamily hydrolase (TIGR01490 family)
MKKIAIFDLDHTIISADSLLLFIIYLIRKYPIHIFYIPYLFFMGILKFFKLISMEELKSKWLIFIKNMDENELDILSSAFVKKKVLPKIKPEVFGLLKELREKDYILIMATASFEFYVKYIFEYLDFDYYFGTRVNYKSNRYAITGNNCKGDEKISRIKEILEPESILRTDSFGYSDCLSDLPFLLLTDTFFLIDKKKWSIKRKINQNRL